MRRTLLVGGLLSSVIGVAAFAPGCAGDGGSSGFTGGTEDGGGGKGADGSFSLNGDGSTGLSSSGGGFQDALPTEDVANLQTCVHNTDCTSPNLCVGDNGVECAGGFCVPTGKPMDCDDGVPCTTDTCDANSNSCVHTPNDSACSADEYCDPTKNCVSQLPCTAGDSVCDRLDVSCSGLWTCDPTKLVCVEGPAPCPSRSNAATTCGTGPVEAGAAVEAGTGDVECSWTCAAGYVDVDGDLNAPVLTNADGNSGSDGCECHLVPGLDGGAAYDPPDLGFIDANCDGIDGTIAVAVFVDHVGGSDSNPGTMSAPLKSITAGINAASLSGGAKTDVYVSTGTYIEQITMAEGVRIFGGYEAANKWQRSTASTAAASVFPNSATAVIAQNLSKPTEIQLFTIQNGVAATGQTAAGDGNSAIGVFVYNVTGGITIDGCTITAADGAPGAAGVQPGSGSFATFNTNQNASGSAAGSAGSSPCGASGGVGGGGISGRTQGGGGTQGTQVNSNSGVGYSGGQGGGAGTCSATASSVGGNAPTFGSGAAGGNGQGGTNGNAGAAFGSFDTSGNYLPVGGGAGQTSGTAGGGGGGGGAGGGTSHAGSAFDLCTDCDENAIGGGGGGGGGGGCGGPPGPGGHGGGGSFAIVVAQSTATIEGNTLTSGTGGIGGAGAAGGSGGQGAQGGSGNVGLQDCSGSCSCQTGGAGAAGTAGGPGGQGGGGAGGTGGPSVCVLYSSGSTTSIGTNHYSSVAGGGGGGGGSNGVQTAATGTVGSTENSQSIN